MALILNIETSTTVCSVSLAKDGEILGFRESADEKSHAKLLTVYIDEIIKEQKVDFKDIDAVAVSMGPGSYTGLRIGVSTAKGLCYAKDIPLIAINTLQSMAHGVINRFNEDEQAVNNFEESLLVPMIDARRMEVYSSIFNTKGETVREIKAEIIEESSFSELLEKQQLIFFGDGSSKIKNTVTHKNAIYLDDIGTSSLYMCELAEEAFKNKKFENVAYFEPFYLKDFVATTPKKNILNQ